MSSQVEIKAVHTVHVKIDGKQVVVQPDETATISREAYDELVKLGAVVGVNVPDAAPVAPPSVIPMEPSPSEAKDAAAKDAAAKEAAAKEAAAKDAAAKEAEAKDAAAKEAAAKDAAAKEAAAKEAAAKDAAAKEADAEDADAEDADAEVVLTPKHKGGGKWIIVDAEGKQADDSLFDSKDAAQAHIDAPAGVPDDLLD